METYDIVATIQCLRCQLEKPLDQLPSVWGRLNVGWTANGGLQVWCVRHECDVRNQPEERPLDIQSYMHCARCLTTKPPHKSPGEWARLSVGWTDDGGLQVWCVRHDCNVVQLKRESDPNAH